MGTLSACNFLYWWFQSLECVAGVSDLFEKKKNSFTQQQDVSEFTHKLLDWLEDAFQMKAEEDR